MLTKLLPMLQESSAASLEYSAKGELGTGGTLVVLAIRIVMIAAV